MNRARIAAFASLLLVATAAAQSRLPERAVTVTAQTSIVRASFGVRDLADAHVRRALASGLQKRFVTTVQLFRVGSSSPVATRSLTCLITYDLWEEAYVVRRGRRTEVLTGVESALERCLVVQNASVAEGPELGALHGQSAFLAVRAEFNPISPSACARSLRRPGSDDPLGPAVVNIVRREICQAERAVDFRSQTFRVP